MGAFGRAVLVRHRFHAVHEFLVLALGVVDQGHRGAGHGCQRGNFAGVVHAHLQHRNAMRVRHAQQVQRHAYGVVEIAARGQCCLALPAHMRAQNGRDHLRDRGLAIAAGHGHQRDVEAQVRLVRAVAAHGFSPGHPREAGIQLHVHHFLEDGADHVLDEILHVALAHEGELHVQLGELQLAVGAQGLVDSGQVEAAVAPGGQDGGVGGLGGVVLGVIEALASTYLGPSAWKDVWAFALLILVLGFAVSGRIRARRAARPGRPGSERWRRRSRARRPLWTAAADRSPSRRRPSAAGRTGRRALRARR